MAGALYTGTSGFAYDEWKHGVFYPEGLKNADMLSYYASRFRSVEINYTFRRFPTEKTLAGWREGTPDGFAFTLKANQRITHFKRLADADDDVRDFLRLAKLLGDRLGTVLFQCTPTLKYDRQLIEQFVGSLPPDVRAVMEFRDASWNLSWDPYGYLRLRKTEYSDEELKAWADRIEPALAAGSDVYCYFKHEGEGMSPRMAERLEALVPSLGSPASGPSLE